MNGWMDGQGTGPGNGPSRVLPLHDIAPFRFLMCWWVGFKHNNVGEYGRGVSWDHMCGTGIGL